MLNIKELVRIEMNRQTVDVETEKEACDHHPKHNLLDKINEKESPFTADVYDKWAVRSNTCWIKFDFKQTVHRIAGFGIVTANDDYNRDPEKVIVYVPKENDDWEELATYKLDFGDAINRFTE